MCVRLCVASSKSILKRLGFHNVHTSKSIWLSEANVPRVWIWQSIGSCERDTAAVRIAPPSMLHFIHTNTHSQHVSNMTPRRKMCAKLKREENVSFHSVPPSPPQSAPLNESMCTLKVFVYDEIVSVYVFGCFIHLLVSLHRHAHIQHDYIQKSFLTKSRICFLLSLSISLTPIVDHSLTYKDKFSPLCLLHSLTLSAIFVFFFSQTLLLRSRTYISICISSIYSFLTLLHLWFFFYHKTKIKWYIHPPEKTREKKVKHHTHTSRERNETKEKETEENSRECVERERPQYNYVCVVLLYTRFYLSQLIGTSS